MTRIPRTRISAWDDGRGTTGRFSPILALAPPAAAAVVHQLRHQNLQIQTNLKIHLSWDSKSINMTRLFSFHTFINENIYSKVNFALKSGFRNFQKIQITNDLSWSHTKSFDFFVYFLENPKSINLKMRQNVRESTWYKFKC